MTIMHTLNKQVCGLASRLNHDSEHDSSTLFFTDGNP